MNSKENILILNNCPAFYKINLYNEIAKHKDIFVIFLGLSNQVVLGANFKEKINFPYIIINDFQVEKRSFFKTLYIILKTLLKFKPSKIIYGGYIEKEFVLLSYFFSKSRNILQTETALETKLSGWRYWLKVFLLSRYSKAIVSGKLHAKVLREMKFTGQIQISKGVGFIEKKDRPNVTKDQNDPLRFLFIGRLIQLKNIEIIIDIFNELGLPLTIVGTGPLKEELALKAKSNITFTGFIENSEISTIYNQCEVFILPSLSEAWGLVIEEALFYGLPIVASNKVGSYPELVEASKTGTIFDPLDKESIKHAIRDIIDNYNTYKNNVDQFDFDKKDMDQLNAYLLL